MAIKRTSTISDPARERRLVWVAQFCCAMGQGMGAVLLTWLVFEGDHGPAVIGLCIAAGVLPLGIGTPLASRWAEIHHRRRLLVGSQAALAVVAGMLFTIDEPLFLTIAAAALLSGLARLVFDASCLSVLHHLVDASRLPAAARDLTSHFHAGHLCGAGLVAALVLTSGPQVLFGPCALAFAAGAVVSSRHHDDINLRPRLRPGLHDSLAPSRRALFAERRLRSLSLATVAAGASAGGAAALVVPYLREDLRLGAGAITVLACGVAAVGIALVLGPRIAGALPWRAVVACALAAHPLALLELAFARSFWEAAVGYAFLASAGAVLGIMINHRRTHTVEDQMRVPISLAGGSLSALAVAGGALGFGLASVPLGEDGAYLTLALAGSLAGAFAYLSARPLRRRPATAGTAA